MNNTPNAKIIKTRNFTNKMKEYNIGYLYMWHLLDYIQLKLKGYKAIGHVRYKNESLAPKEWKVSLWTKIKNNDLLQPININSEEHKKEFRIFIQGKVVIIAINIFLFSFIYSFVKDTYTISKAKYNIYKIENIDFKKQIPDDLIKTNDQKWISFVENKLKTDFYNNNYDLIKSNLFSLGNNLLIIYMISKYYWKKKKNN